MGRAHTFVYVTRRALPANAASCRQLMVEPGKAVSGRQMRGLARDEELRGLPSIICHAQNCRARTDVPVTRDLPRNLGFGPLRRGIAARIVIVTGARIESRLSCGIRLVDAIRGERCVQAVVEERSLDACFRTVRARVRAVDCRY